MDGKYTIGELAKKAGISTKAIRIYEKKGLLRPTDYSKGNYRLYDEEAKIVLQKIITFKFIGFSLNEIGKLLERDKDNNLQKSLAYQKQLLKLKRNQIDRIIYCIDRAAERCTKGEMQWESFTDIMQAVIADRKADESHWTAYKYSADKDDWYEGIYNNLSIKDNESVLDIGCGYGTLWRNSWRKIPKKVKVTLMDLHGTWADDFQKFIEQNSVSLQKGTKFDFVWENVENQNSFTGKYNHIIADYLFTFISEKEKLMYRIKNALSDDGTFHCIYGSNTVSLEKIAALLKGIDSNLYCIDEKISQRKAEGKEFEQLLNSVFDSVEWTTLNSGIKFENATEFYEYLMKRDFPLDYNYKQKQEFENYFSKLIEKEGEIIIPSETYLYYCR